MSHCKFKLAAVVRETPEVKTFRFEPLESFSFKAGQFVLLRLDGESRAYSISSHPSEPLVGLTVRIAPDSYFPKKIERLKIGDVVEMDGPFGAFSLDSSTTEAVFIGAGVGIAGLRALWSEHLRKPGASATIVYSAKTERDIVWRSELEALPRTKLVLTLTRENPAGWKGELGRIDAAMLKRHITSPASKHYCVCGPPEMVEATKADLLRLGVPEARIKSESWGGIAGSV
ncbi:MAG: FAD-binding oxidoreductase [Candidatus Aenigmatarchaeota archaeon]